VRRSIPVVFVLLFSSCANAPLEVVPFGGWAQALPTTDLNLAELRVDANGGAKARFGLDTVSDPSGVINYCANATLPRLALDADGHFDVIGTKIGRGPGLTEGFPQASAEFSGSVHGNTMDLTVTTVDGVWGRFTLTQGAPLRGVRLCVD
jgi:hypothetical protein